MSSPLKIVIGNIRLAKRTGTEIVTRDFALGLKRRGHVVAALTRERGPFAEELELAGVPVCIDPADLRFCPDIFHFNHAALAEAAFRRFAIAPAIFHCHAPGDQPGDAVRHPAFRRRFGISTACCRVIDTALGCDGRSDGILGNYVDLSLGEPRASLPTKPERWLVVCEKKHGLRLLGKIALLAWSRGARISAVGPRVRRRIENVPAEAARHDLVFASARCALEAATSGAGVIVLDYRGLAGFLNATNCAAWQRENFGVDLLHDRPTFSALRRAVADYDPVAALQATALLRATASLESGLDRLETIYREVIAEHGAAQTSRQG